MAGKLGWTLVGNFYPFPLSSSYSRTDLGENKNKNKKQWQIINLIMKRKVHCSWRGSSEGRAFKIPSPAETSEADKFDITHLVPG